MGRDVCTITLCDGQPMGEEALTDVINFAARTNRGRLLTDVINFAARTNNTQIIEGGACSSQNQKPMTQKSESA